MKKSLEKAFTLVELLIVIGIIGVLSVTVLVNLNPGEAQKKSRDAQRIKDLGDLYNAIELYVADTGNTFTGALAGTPRFSNGLTNDAQRTNCTNSGWLELAVNLCPYIKRLPLDPRNTATIGFTTSTGGTVSAVARYGWNVEAGTTQMFKLYTRLESRDNRAKYAQDGGNSAEVYEVYGTNSSNVTVPATY